MSRTTRLSPGAPWVRLDTTRADWNAARVETLGTMLVQLHLIRAFEETVLDLAGRGLVHGPAHSSIGQEGGAVGALLGIRSTDAINGSHRGHHQFLAKALGHVSPLLDPKGEISEDVRTLLHRSLSEILGLKAGFCAGRGGSMHLQWFDAGCLGTNAIVGGGVPLATGNAWAQKLAATDDVTLTFFGDGAMNIGSTLESMNLASAFNLPVCFFVENNQYAVSTRVSEASRETRLSARALGFSIPSWQVDGMDPLAVHLATQEAVAHMRAGNGPTMVEVEVYRYFHQNGPYPGSAFGYRAKDEESAWRERDPVRRVGEEMVRRALLDAEQVDAVRQRAQRVMSEIVAQLTEPVAGGKPGESRIRPELWPDPGFVDVGIRGDARELAGVTLLDEQETPSSTVQRKFSDAIAGTLADRMAKDERVIVLGEDVHRLNGGTNGATKGLAESFPNRVIGTPISENAFVGAGGGMALDGRVRPVVELMYSDFLWVAADQLFNQVGKARHMFGGQRPVPLVVRSKVAMGTGYGSQHSMDPAGILTTAPGWRVVAPSCAQDYVGLMNTALTLDDPVFVIEHVDLYGNTSEVPEDLSYHLALGKAAVRRYGADVTVLAYLNMVGEALTAVQEVGVDAEVIDLRWLDRASIDWGCIEDSVRKTGAVLIVEQGALGTSYGGWLADEIQRRLFDYLDQPVRRVTGSVASPSISKVLERAAIAKAPEIAAGLRAVVAEMGGVA